MLQKILLFIGVLSVSFLLRAKANLPLEESVWVADPELKNFQKIKANNEFIIDHRKAKGFEVYGPRGLKKWLKDQGIEYQEAVQSQKERDDLLASYPSWIQVEEKLKGLASRYPQVAQLISVGESVKGKPLYFLKISKNPKEDFRLPEFKYISSMHGDEITGRELMLRFAEEILSQYGVDQGTTELIDNTEIYIMPSMNPDGSEAKTRWNANFRDLNRNFPDFTEDLNNTLEGRELETAAIMKFQAERNFSLSANFHGGSEVINYPWDTSESPHPLDALIQTLSLSYSKLVPYMFNSPEFPQGIVNGFAWYEVNGGMQDWSEHWYHDLQVTVELSNAKWPFYSEIPRFYQENKSALIQFVKNIHQGAGFYFSNSKESGEVSVWRADKKIGDYAFRNGEFYRVLEPGSYEFKVMTEDKKSFEFSRQVIADSVVQNGNYFKIEN